MTAIAFDNSYARLPERFYARLSAQPVADPQLLALNEPLAAFLGLDLEWLQSADGIAMLAGNAFPDGAASIAQAYAGHQFGNWVPQLGDGRALMVGEVIAKDGKRYDIQLKGSGQTPFSRMGDGRAALGPAIREYVMSEAMHALGVPTTRALAVLSTGDTVLRDSGPQPGGIVVRVASSHIRVGTFQYFYAREDHDALRLLVDHSLERHDPDRIGDGAKGLLESVIDRQATLIARWLHLGFIHGVMNTDNMTISGETIDYGPCAFLDHYDPGKVFSSIDQFGRYAYANQPNIGQWNLGNFAQTLLPLLDDSEATAIEIAK
ncbi:MAG: YdiU family protein, partial [Pseudomonadota bacterium]